MLNSKSTLKIEYFVLNTNQKHRIHCKNILNSNIVKYVIMKYVSGFLFFLVVLTYNIYVYEQGHSKIL